MQNRSVLVLDRLLQVFTFWKWNDSLTIIVSGRGCQWRHSLFGRERLGTSWAHNHKNSSMIFHSNQEICIRFHDNGVYFVLVTGLCINLSGTVTPSQIIRPSSLWKLQLVGPSSSCFIVLPSFSRLDFFQVKNYATRTR